MSLLPLDDNGEVLSVYDKPRLSLAHRGELAGILDELRLYYEKDVEYFAIRVMREVMIWTRATKDKENET